MPKTPPFPPSRNLQILEGLDKKINLVISDLSSVKKELGRLKAHIERNEEPTSEATRETPPKWNNKQDAEQNDLASKGWFWS